MAILESGEMYLETILLLGRKMNTFRAIDVGNEMGFSKPSVSRGLKLLREAEMITVDENGYIALTPSGMETAERIYERHQILTEAFVRIFGISQETAENDACRIEHVISDESFEKIKDKLR
ncbi:MAG: metal-dependent transcriptional regulator [Clostridia bacterium]|nr:metal-dependent transcriptional regulator [Clostridia bacterium]